MDCILRLREGRIALDVGLTLCPSARCSLHEEARWHRGEGLEAIESSSFLLMSSRIRTLSSKRSSSEDIIGDPTPEGDDFSLLTAGPRFLGDGVLVLRMFSLLRDRRFDRGVMGGDAFFGEGDIVLVILLNHSSCFSWARL